MGYLVLALATVTYAVGIVAQTVAAKRNEQRGGLDLGLVARLARDRVYLLGFGVAVRRVRAGVPRPRGPAALPRAGRDVVGGRASRR